MYVSDSLRLVYMAVPRTASRAVGQWLKRDHHARATGSPSRMGPVAMGDHHGINGPQLQRYMAMDYRVIVPVRNPWDAVVSWWHHNPRWFDKDGQDFAAFARRFPRHGRNRYIVEGRLFWYWARFATHIVHYETLRQDLARILHVPINLDVIGASDRRPYHEYYDDELRDFIGEAFAPEIEEYGYFFQGRT